ncbi:class I SAM-dependent methyltransferase [Actinocorallia longicatena]|uniref:Class I SAM-dependent methyltransferase n=1 Tax=Actinocorallia longicatena TaxID=111803 RepID=A0ABP6Q5G8_9ACTN
MADLRERWKRDRLTAAVYDLGVQSYPVAWAGGRALWGYEINRLWKSVGELAGTPDDSVVLDLPCGGGTSFRALSRGRRLRYVAADLSETMLDRARAQAAGRSLGQVRFVRTDAGSLPFADASFDLVTSFNGLHVFADPAGAVAEFARVLRPGGTLRGTAVVTGERRRGDLLVRALRLTGTFGPAGSADDLESWLSPHFDDVEIETAGSVAGFSARRITP